MKRTFRYLSVCLLVVAACFIFSGCSDYRGDSKQVMDEINISAQLKDNGDMAVTERWRVTLEDRDKSYRNFYRTFSNVDSKTGGITDFSVYDEDYQKQYSFEEGLSPYSSTSSDQDKCYIYESYGSTELGWFMPALDEGTRTFTIQYTIRDFVDVYDDTSVLYYQFMSSDFAMPRCV